MCEFGEFCWIFFFYIDVILIGLIRVVSLTIEHNWITQLVYTIFFVYVSTYHSLCDIYKYIHSIFLTFRVAYCICVFINDKIHKRGCMRMWGIFIYTCELEAIVHIRHSTDTFEADTVNAFNGGSWIIHLKIIIEIAWWKWKSKNYKKKSFEFFRQLSQTQAIQTHTTEWLNESPHFRMQCH